jgi:hypothetical protein
MSGIRGLLGRTADQRLPLLFRRDFRGLTGGHLKVWHYFRHAAGSARFRPLVYLTPGSVRGPTNPWNGSAPPPLKRWDPDAAGALFLAGLDWEDVPSSTRTPVVNLIQGMRHALADDPRRRFLSRPAVRICVSPEVAEAIAATGEVNGPILTIPAALDTAEFPPAAVDRDLDLVVAGLKNPSLAMEIAGHWTRAGVRVVAPVHALDRREYLGLFGRARIVVPLPCEQEGFFLPALEAMAMGALVVCPDCVGNRSFCRNGVTCLRPAYRADEINAAVRTALALPAGVRSVLQAAAAEEVRRHAVERERSAFLRILDGLAPRH